MKKILSLFAILLIIPACVFAESNDVYYTNINGVEMTQDEYQHLKNLGFEEFEIKYMSVEDFETNKSTEGEIVATADKYFKTVGNPIVGYQTYVVSEDDYKNDSSAEITPFISGYIETTYKKMSTSIVKYGNYYRFTNLMQWKIIPATRSYDIIGIGFNGNTVAIANLISFDQYISYTDGTDKTENIYEYKSLKNGGGASFKIPSGSNVASLQSKLSFLVKKVTSDTQVTLCAIGDYSHATSNISISNSEKYTVDMSGIYLDSSITNYYDAMKSNDITTTVTW